MTIHGTPKPAYRAFELLHGAGMERMAVEGACPFTETCAAPSAGGLPGAVRAGERCTDTLNNTAVRERCLRTRIRVQFSQACRR